MPPTEGERIAVLETQTVELQRQQTVVFDKLEDHDEALDEIRNGVHEIRGTIKQYRSFVGGVVFTITAVGGVMGALLMALWRKLTG